MEALVLIHGEVRLYMHKFTIHMYVCVHVYVCLDTYICPLSHTCLPVMKVHVHIYRYILTFILLNIRTQAKTSASIEAVGVHTPARS